MFNQAQTFRAWSFLDLRWIIYYNFFKSNVVFLRKNQAQTFLDRSIWDLKYFFFFNFFKSKVDFFIQNRKTISDKIMYNWCFRMFYLTSKFPVPPLICRLPVYLFGGHPEIFCSELIPQKLLEQYLLNRHSGSHFIMSILVTFNKICFTN